MNTTERRVIPFKRPKLLLCDHCGHEFTQLAFHVHNLSCFKNDLCSCFVCKISKSATADQSSSLNCKNTERENNNVLNEKSLHRSSTNDENDVQIHDSLLPNKPQKQLSTSNSAECHEQQGIDAIFSIEMQKTCDILHDGMPCGRKIFCSVCQNHITFRNFGEHVLQHCREIKGSFVCPLCSESKTSAVYFLLHFYCHISSHPSNCTKCKCGFHPCLVPVSEYEDFCFTDSTYFYCYICLHFFTHFQNLFDHMVLHTKQLTPNKICDRTFKPIGNIQVNTVTYSLEKSHRSNKLQNNCNSFLKQKPYVCSVCSKSFIRAGPFQRHTDLHHIKGTNFSIEQCSINSSENLNTDIAKTSSPITTKNPDASQKLSLKEDQMKARKDKPFKCDICNRRFAQRAAIRTHKIRHHPSSLGRGWRKI